MPLAARSRFPWLVRLLLLTGGVALLFGLFRLTLHRAVARQIEVSVQNIPGCKGIRYDKLTIPYFSFQCTFHNVILGFDGDQTDISLREIHLRRFRPGDTLPLDLDAALSGIQIPPGQPLLAPLQPVLKRLGYPALRGDLLIRWTRQGASEGEWVVKLDLKIVDAGGMILRLRLDKVNAQGIVLALSNPLHWLLVLPPLEIIEGEVQYQDAGLWERIQADAARREERTPVEFRESLIQDLRKRIRIEKDPDIQSVWRSLEAFCRGSGRIALHTQLTHPVPLGQILWMRQPRDLIRGLAVRAPGT